VLAVGNSGPVEVDHFLRNASGTISIGLEIVILSRAVIPVLMRLISDIAPGRDGEQAAQLLHPCIASRSRFTFQRMDEVVKSIFERLQSFIPF